MQTILKLFKLQIDNKSDFLKTTNIKKMLFSILKYILIIGAATLLLSVVLLRIFILGFNTNAELIAIVLLVTQIISLFFAIGNVIKNLYLSKDNELLMVLPATPNQIFMSKIMVIYAQELLVNTLISLPLFLSIGIVGGLNGVYFLSIPFMLILLPILPISLASLLSIPVMAVIRYLKSKTILSIVAILVVVALCVTAYSVLLGKIAGSFNIVDRQIETVRKINQSILNIGSKIIVFYQIALAMLNISKCYWILVFLGLCAVIFVLSIFIIRPLYFKTAMSNLENSVKPLVKEKAFKKRSPFMSLINKEVIQVFRSPGYMFDYFLFTFLMPFIVVCYDKLMLSIAVSQAGEVMIAGSHVLVIGIIAILSNISSASAISREGGNFYISKVSPVDYYRQIFAKLTFNAIFTLSALIITMFVSMFYLNPLQVFMGTLAVAFMSIGHIAISIDMDIKKPKLDWYSAEETSSSGSLVKSMIVGMLMATVLGGIVILMAFTKAVFVPWLIILIIGLAFAIWRVYILVLRINLQYDKIEI